MNECTSLKMAKAASDKENACARMEPRGKIIICLGGPLDERTCEPGGHLSARLQETVDQFKKGDVVIVTGGRPQRLALSEAEVMQRHLKCHQIESIKEERSTSTLENAIFTRSMIGEPLPRRTHILVITSDFHLPRAALIFNGLFPEHSLWFRGTQKNAYHGRKDSVFLNEGQHLKDLLSHLPLSYPKQIEHSIIDDAKRGYKEGVEQAIADIRCVDSAGCTALHYAASYGFADVTSLLITSGANVNAQSRGRMTPLHYAILNGRTETACLLLETAQCDLSLKAAHPRFKSPSTCSQLLPEFREYFGQVHYTVCILMLVKHAGSTGPSVAWIRHAESMANCGKANKFDTDAALSDDGRVMARQIGELAKRFKLFENFDVISSPMTRALETGRLVGAANSQSQPLVDHRIRERVNAFGDIGTPVSSVIAKYPEYTFANVPEYWWYCPERNGSTPGHLELEPRHLLRERVDGFVAELGSSMAKSGRSTLVVTHGGVIDYIFGLHPRNCEIYLSRPRTETRC